MINKKNKKIFLLLFSVFLILTIFYFSFNKISSLENLRNQITPLTSDSETISYCGSSDPYDSDGIQIKNKKIAGCTKNHWMTPTFLNNSCGFESNIVRDYDTKEYTLIKPGKSFYLLGDDNNAIPFDKITSQEYKYRINMEAKDDSDYITNPSINLRSGTTELTSDSDPFYKYSTTINNKCKYDFYIE